MPAPREQPILLRLADQSDDVLGRAMILIKPVTHLLDQQALVTFRQEAADFQRQLERVAAAATLAQSLLTCGLPESRDAVVYRKLTQIVK